MRFGIKSILVGILVAAVVAALLSELPRRQRRNATEARIVTSLSIIWKVLSIYETSEGSAPPSAVLDADGTPMCSWRYRLTPLIEDLGTTIDFDKPWDGQENANSKSLRVTTFCYDDELQPGSLQTNVFAVVGPDTLFDSTHRQKLSDVDDDLVIAIEIGDSKTHWMEPGDFDAGRLAVAKDTVGNTVGSLIPGCVHVLFADGEVWSLRSDTPMEAFKPFLTNKGARSHVREKELSKYMLNRWE
jgi:hypothetical protein